LLFNSYEYIFIFLPLTFFIYFYLNKKRLIAGAKGFLVFASLFFYSYWNILYLPLILGSMLFNFIIGNSLSKKEIRVSKKTLLTIGVVGNIALLGYFKYTDFFIDNLNYWIFVEDIPNLNLALPLAISFFTFQQIAYLVDSYRGETKEYDFLNYAVFVTFFPQLIAGPIVHHKEMMPQFASKWNLVKNYKNIATGLFIFSIGLFKKVVIADTFAKWANAGFDNDVALTFFEAWATSLSYTFQLYFDFSGYTDMAIGAALLFNIKLPINFNSPYKATDIQDFWRRWHITLSRFLRDYVYIPLGGNRRSEIRVYANLFTTFLIGGIWHGAGWTFVLWGALHGVAMIVHRAWQKIGFILNTIIAWFITFNFINLTWVFFRAESFEDALRVIKGMLGLKGVGFTQKWMERVDMFTTLGFSTIAENSVNSNFKEQMLYWIVGAILLVVFAKNSNEVGERFKPNNIYAFFAIALIVISLLKFTQISQFLYFNF
jgi:D-alanyl-lipoteichoic acid acyltransferase DltB (MBOAT superfamily)